MADLTGNGRAFQSLGAVTEKALSSLVTSRVLGNDEIILKVIISIIIMH